MTIRFAAAWGGKSPNIVRALCPSAPLDAVNDNGRMSPAKRAMAGYNATLGRPELPRQAANDERLLADALRHFARHGLSAAVRARANAEAARADGDEEACHWWIAICGQLDRRMAEAFARKIGSRV